MDVIDCVFFYVIRHSDFRWLYWFNYHSQSIQSLSGMSLDHPVISFKSACIGEQRDGQWFSFFDKKQNFVTGIMAFRQIWVLEPPDAVFTDADSCFTKALCQFAVCQFPALPGSQLMFLQIRLREDIVIQDVLSSGGYVGSV